MKSYQDPQLSPQERAEALTDLLTVEEQIGQLKYDAEPIERLGIPAYNWWNEGLHGLARAGTATMFPQAIGLAAMFDPDLLQKAADITATEARAKYNEITQKHGDRDIYKGLTIWSPNINIFRDPRWGRGHETFGEDPFLTAQLGKAYVRGLQGDLPILKTAACAKHLAAHSGPEGIRHGFDAKVSAKDLEETYLPAFKALVTEAQVESVMGAYNSINGIPSCANPFLQEKLREWGFDGYFVSDCWAIRDFHEYHHITSRPEESAAMAINAGCDLNCGCTYPRLFGALQERLVDKEAIRRACVHVMRTRIRLGMFDETTPYDDIPYEVVACRAHKDIALRCAQQSMVLLRNNGILPLNRKTCKTIAVIGPNSDSRLALEGNYCGTADRYITFLEGIQDAFDGRVLYSEGCHLYRDRISNLAQAGDRYAEAVTAAEHADVVVLCLGLDATLEGEEGDTGNEFASGDKPDLLLPEPQRILLEKIMETGKPVIAVVAAGSAIHLNAKPDALLHVWYPGAEGGKALASLLFGDVSPSGKLPVTFYESAALLPDFADYSMLGRTYRYAQNNVEYPFGFGLTYGKIVCTSVTYRNGIAYVTAENQGERTVSDVIQLYLKDTCKEAVPNHSLCGFQRVTLAPGESAEYAIPVPEQAFTAVDENGVRGVFGKTFTLFAGVCQPDPHSEALSGTVCVRTTCRHDD